jgi:hypothetical protein
LVGPPASSLKRQSPMRQLFGDHFFLFSAPPSNVVTIACM